MDAAVNSRRFLRVFFVVLVFECARTSVCSCPKYKTRDNPELKARQMVKKSESKAYKDKMEKRRLEMKEQERHFEDLDESEKDVIRAISSVKDIEEFKLGWSWDDDHCPCFGVRINGVSFGLWWLTYKEAVTVQDAGAGKLTMGLISVIRKQDMS
jgi:hypothetical protein